MGQKIRGRAEAPSLSADPERSIGAYLAQQRELRGISLDELATLTRIPRRSLERLESGIFDRAPDGFVRGFVRTVAAALGLDPDETVTRLLSEPAVDVEVEGGRGGRMARPGPSARWAALAVAGLLAAGALAWLATSVRERPAPPKSDEVVVRQDPIRDLARQAPVLPPPTSEIEPPSQEAAGLESPPQEAAAAAESPPQEAAAPEPPPQEAAGLESPPQEAAAAPEPPPQEAAGLESPPQEAAAPESPPQEAAAPESPPQEAAGLPAGSDPVEGGSGVPGDAGLAEPEGPGASPSGPPPPAAPDPAPLR